MVLSTFNHIQGGNGSHRNGLMRGVNAENPFGFIYRCLIF